MDNGPAWCCHEASGDLVMPRHLLSHRFPSMVATTTHRPEATTTTPLRRGATPRCCASGRTCESFFVQGRQLHEGLLRTEKPPLFVKKPRALAQVLMAVAVLQHCRGASQVSAWVHSGAWYTCRWGGRHQNVLGRVTANDLVLAGWHKSVVDWWTAHFSSRASLVWTFLFPFQLLLLEFGPLADAPAPCVLLELAGSFKPAS